jgi:hypothetical protein
LFELEFSGLGAGIVVAVGDGVGAKVGFMLASWVGVGAGFAEVVLLGLTPGLRATVDGEIICVNPDDGKVGFQPKEPQLTREATEPQ